MPTELSALKIVPRSLSNKSKGKTNVQSLSTDCCDVSCTDDGVAVLVRLTAVLAVRALSITVTLCSDRSNFMIFMFICLIVKYLIRCIVMNRRLNNHFPSFLEFVVCA